MLFFSASFVWWRDKVVLVWYLDCILCTFKVSKKPNVLNLGLKFPPPLEALRWVGFFCLNFAHFFPALDLFLCAPLNSLWDEPCRSWIQEHKQNLQPMLSSNAGGGVWKCGSKNWQSWLNGERRDIYLPSNSPGQLKFVVIFWNKMTFVSKIYKSRILSF